MHHKSIEFFLAVAATLLSFVCPVLADPLEYDRCSCKLAMKGAESTLKGGVCVRTEASTCLMEWNSGSVARATIGSGQSQRDAGMRADSEFSKATGDTFQIPRLRDFPLPDNSTKLDVAIQNLVRVPPSEYSKNGVPESFLLAAGSALVRIAKSSVDFIAPILLQKRRDEFINLLSKGGEMKVEQYLVRGIPGCLIIEDQTQRALVFVKTPFAASEGC